MISYSQIIKKASNLGLPQETIEKDYFIELLLLYIAQNKVKDDLVFRGGTALKKIYFPDYRFSEDIDFLTRIELGSLFNKFKRILKRLNDSFPVEAVIGREILKNDRWQVFIKYNIAPQITANKELKVDILRNHYLPPNQKRKIKFSYQDLQNFQAELLVYDLEAIAVDKISRILEIVNEPRDIYDLWYLLKLELNCRKIKKIFKEKHSFPIYKDNLLSEIEKEEYKTNWQIRLSRQIPVLPDFEKIRGEIISLVLREF